MPHENTPDHITYWHYTADVLEGTPTILGKFDRRALIAATAGDTVILHGLDDVPEEVELLWRLGIGPGPDGVMLDASEARGRIIHPFSGTSAFQRAAAAAYGVRIAGSDHGTCLQANSKALMQSMWERDHTLPIPPGFTTTRRGLPRTLGFIRGMFGEDQTFRAKPDHSASGLGQFVIPPGIMPGGLKGADEEVFVLQKEIFAGEDPANVMQVSIPFRIHRDGEADKFTYGLPTGQHIGSDGSSHKGNYSISAQSHPRLFTLNATMHAAAAAVLACIFDSTHYRGVGSLDLIVNLRTGEVFVIDPNFRVYAPWYVRRMMIQRFGRELSYDMRSFEIPTSATVAQLEQHFGDILLHPGLDQGFVPFCVLPEHGFCYGTVIAPDDSSRDALSRRVEDMKAELAA